VLALQLFRGGGPEQWTAFAQQLRARLAAIPGVQSAAVTTAAPLSTIGNRMTEVRVAGRAEPEPLEASLRRVSPGYLNLLEIPLLAGRDIADADQGGSERVAIVSRSFAQRVFGARDPIGASIALPFSGEGWTDYRIVGISGDIRNAGLRSESHPEILVSFAQVPWVGVTFLVRADAAVPGVAQHLREAMWEIDPLQATTREFALAQDLEAELLPARFFARTVGAFAGCALLLAALGVYAVAAQYQQQRRAEFGLRLAVGAAPGRLLRQSLGASLRGAALGMGLGAAGGLLALQALQSQLFGFGTGYLPWLLLAIASMGLAVLLASLPAAMRAARTEPMLALRHE
jgi:putative ABC transport system permease protein